MKNFLTLTLLFFAVNVFGQSSPSAPTVKKITDYTPYSSPIGAGGFIPISINNATRSVEAYWINRGSFDSVKLRIDSVKTALGGKIDAQKFIDSLTAMRTWVNAQSFLKTETDPKRLLYITVTGTNTKNGVATLADSTKIPFSFTDLQATGGTGTFTFTGTSSQYVAGDGSYVTFPTIPINNNQLTNGSGFITSSALSPYLTSATAASTYATQSSVATTNANVTTNTNAIGTLSSLTTTAKNNLVAAINEVNAKPTGGGSATLYTTTGTNTDGAMTQAATTAALGAKQDTAGAKIYFDSNDFYKDGATSSTALRVKGKADSTTTATALSGKQGTLTLTTTGTSGAATLTGNTLNIPNYATTGGGGGGSVGTAVGANMYRLASQSFTGGADTKVLFDNTDFDNDGTVADLTNNRFNITTTGIYIIAIQARLNTVASGEHVIKASKNGTTELLRAVQYEYNSGIATQMNGSMVVKLTAGDYVEMFVNVPTTTSSIGSIPAVSPRMSIAQIK